MTTISSRAGPGAPVIAGVRLRAGKAVPDPDNPGGLISDAEVAEVVITAFASADALAEIDGLLPGSVVVRLMRCGKRNCACKADPPVLHGPYTQWTRTVHGKTVTRLLTDDQLARYQPWFDNSRRLKDLIAKLEIVSLQAIETGDQLTAKSATPPYTPGRKHRKPQI